MENKALHSMKKQDLLEFITNSVDGIKTQHDKAKKLADDVEKCKTKADGCLSKIQQKKTQANDLSNKIDTQNENIKNLHSKVKKWHSDSKNYTSNIQEQQKTTVELTNEIQKQHETAKTYVSEIEQQKNTTTELTNEIQKQHETDTKLIEQKQNQYEELVKQIEGLLPGATSAGLAGSYRDAHKEKKVRFYWVGFIGSLIVLVFGYYVYFTNQAITWMNIIIRTIIGMPLIWIAWYCQKSISQTNRIKEEYHHKQRVMAVFNGFSKQIDELTKGNPEENKEQKLKLISVIIEAIKKNPSEKIDPSETFLDSVKNKTKKTDTDQTSEEIEK